MFCWHLYRFGIPNDALFLEENGMSKTPPDLTDLPVQAQAYVAAQAAELAALKQAVSGSFAEPCGSAQKRLKDEMEAALAAERAAHARAIQNKDAMIADLRLQLHHWPNVLRGEGDIRLARN